MTAINKAYLEAEVVKLDNAKLGLNEKEVFKRLLDYPDYLVGNYGTMVSQKRGNHVLSSKVDVNKSLDYPMNRLSKTVNGKEVRKTYRVHRLVALYFVPNTRKDAKQVNHMNGVRTANRYTNLEWVTAQENMEHAVGIGLSFKNQSVYSIQNEKYEEEKFVIGLKGLKTVWNDNYGDTAYYNRAHKREFVNGLRAIKVGVVKDLFPDNVIEELYEEYTTL